VQGGSGGGIGISHIEIAISTRPLVAVRVRDMLEQTLLPDRWAHDDEDLARLHLRLNVLEHRHAVEALVELLDGDAERLLGKGATELSMADQVTRIFGDEVVSTRMRISEVTTPWSRRPDSRGPPRVLSPMLQQTSTTANPKTSALIKRQTRPSFP